MIENLHVCKGCKEFYFDKLLKKIPKVTPVSESALAEAQEIVNKWNRGLDTLSQLIAAAFAKRDELNHEYSAVVETRIAELEAQLATATTESKNNAIAFVDCAKRLATARKDSERLRAEISCWNEMYSNGPTGTAIAEAMTTPTEITAKVRAIAREAALHINRIHRDGAWSETKNPDDLIASIALRAIVAAFVAAGVKEALEQLLPRYAEMFMACNLGNPNADSVPYQEGHAALAAINELEKLS